MTSPETSSALSPEDAAKRAAREKFAGFADHLFWDLPPDHREQYYAREVFPALSATAGLTRAEAKYNVTSYLQKGLSEENSSMIAAPKSARIPRPSFRSPTLLRKSGYLVILRNEEFNYYRCLVEPSGEYLFRMKEPAPIFSEGVYILDKEIYFVTEQDLRRGLVRKARKLTLKRLAITYADITTNNVFPAPKSGTNTARSGTSAISGIPAATPGTIQDPDNVGSVSASDLAELQAIDLAFNEQVRELLGASSQEEVEWEASENP